MAAMRGLALLLVAAAAAPLAGARAADRSGPPAELTGEPRALASNGAIVAMPAIDGLGCAGMAEVLDRIDQSRYRDARPVPEGHPDREIFDYEHRLAATHYRSCIMTGHTLEDPAPAFSQGFQPR